MISIIIPAYNADKYINNCLDSILKQELRDYEAIIIDDASTDDTGKICKGYCDRDCRFRYFLQPQNLGVSCARNVGLALAKGEYIAFIDSDDWVDKKYLSSLIDSTDVNIDLIACGYYVDSGTNELFCRLDDDIYTKEAFMAFFIQKKCSYALWNKLYKREIIHNNSIQFSAGIKYGEDQTFNLLYIQHCDKIRTISSILYHYRINDGQATATFNMKYFDDYFQNSQNVFHGLHGNIRAKQITLALFCTVMNEAFGAMERTNIPDKEKEDKIREVKLFLKKSIMFKGVLINRYAGRNARVFRWILRIVPPKTILKLYAIIGREKEK